MSKIRVVVVDDSDLCRAVLHEILEADGDIEVVGEASDGRAALDVVVRSQAQLVTMDVEMPKVDGLAAVEQIMDVCPLPVLVVTGRAAELRTATHFEAIQRGALDLVAKPSLGRPEEAIRLRCLVRELAQVPVMRHLAARRAKRLAVGAAACKARREQVVRVVGVCASAGGPAAVAALLGRLPRDFPACITVVQHLLPDFCESFVRFLRTATPLRVEMVRRASPFRSATVLVAADDRHLVASSDGSFVASDAPAVKGYRPSADMLFGSLARTFGGAAAGVVLSGIGDDGADGLLAIRDAGGLTLAQDEESAAVFGMPRAARESGAAERALSVPELAGALLRAATRAQPREPFGGP